MVHLKVTFDLLAGMVETGLSYGPGPATPGDMTYSYTPTTCTLEASFDTTREARACAEHWIQTSPGISGLFIPQDLIPQDHLSLEEEFFSRPCTTQHPVTIDGRVQT